MLFKKPFGGSRTPPKMVLGSKITPNLGIPALLEFKTSKNSGAVIVCGVYGWILNEQQITSSSPCLISHTHTHAQPKHAYTRNLSVLKHTYTHRTRKHTHTHILARRHTARAAWTVILPLLALVKQHKDRFQHIADLNSNKSRQP